MNEVVVYGTLGSPYLRSVLLGLEERRASYNLVPVKYGEHTQEPHLSRHPFARVPVIEQDGFLLYETQAILRYIAERFDGPPLVPARPQDMARMNQLIGIVDWYFYPQITRVITWQRMVVPRFGQKPDEAAIENALPQARTAVREIERLMDGKGYLAGNALSLADLVLAPQLDYFKATPEGAAVMQQHTHLGGWLSRMRERPSMKSTQTPTS